jgi:hypothetical protein
MSKLYAQLEAKIQDSYESGTTVDQAEKLAAEFLHAQLKVSDQLKVLDLDARMRKSGVKSIKAALYLDAVQKNDKKPTEAMLSALIDSNELTVGEQSRLDEAEAEKAHLERYYDIFTNAHIFFRGVAKGNFS